MSDLATPSRGGAHLGMPVGSGRRSPHDNVIDLCSDSEEERPIPSSGPRVKRHLDAILQVPIRRSQ